MAAHVDRFERRQDAVQQGAGERSALSGQGEDGAVVGGIGVAVEKRCAPRELDSHRLDARQVATLGHIWSS